jgi:DNA invertase Pin-like site-specific DNA recombinase
MGGPGSGRPHTCVKCERVIELYRKGFSARAVGKKTNCSRQRVVDILKRHGVARRANWMRTV